MRTSEMVWVDESSLDNLLISQRVPQNFPYSRVHCQRPASSGDRSERHARLQSYADGTGTLARRVLDPEAGFVR